MSLKNSPELLSFLSTYFPEADADADAESVRTYLASASPAQVGKTIAQTKAMAASGDLSLEDLGIETNRWFASIDEAREWLAEIAGLLESESAGDSGANADTPTKDVNGAILNEGDSVQVIKDLKVRGGSSDLKRGTLVKKIHLIGDPDHIECRVDGSTLVLKTCFLKKV